MPNAGASEAEVRYFLCFLFAVILGKEFFVHDTHDNQKFSFNQDNPDMAILMTATKDLLLPVTCNIVVEVKVDRFFGKPDHIDQAKKYGINMCVGYFFPRSYVI